MKKFKTLKEAQKDDEFYFKLEYGDGHALSTRKDLNGGVFNKVKNKWIHPHDSNKALKDAEEAYRKAGLLKII